MSHWLHQPLTTNLKTKTLTLQFFIFNDNNSLLLARPQNSSTFTIPSATTKDLHLNLVTLTLRALQCAIEDRTLREIQFAAFVNGGPVVEDEDGETKLSLLLLAKPGHETPGKGTVLVWPKRFDEYKWVDAAGIGNVKIDRVLAKSLPKMFEQVGKIVQMHAILRRGSLGAMRREECKRYGEILQNLIRTEVHVKAIETSSSMTIVLIALSPDRETIHLMDASPRFIKDFPTNKETYIVDGGTEWKVIGCYAPNNGKLILTRLPETGFFGADGFLRVQWIVEMRETWWKLRVAEEQRRDSAVSDEMRYPTPEMVGKGAWGTWGPLPDPPAVRMGEQRRGPGRPLGTGRKK